MSRMGFVFNDGGRAAAGFKGDAGDCVTRAVAIATMQNYRQVYEDLAYGNANERQSSRQRGAKRRSARDGIHTKRKWFKDYMTALGWKWVPCMFVGIGCEVHLAAGELPSTGRLIVAVSKHYTAVVDGVIHDTHDPQRATIWHKADGSVDRVSQRCVYGYWINQLEL